MDTIDHQAAGVSAGADPTAKGAEAILHNVSVAVEVNGTRNEPREASKKGSTANVAPSKRARDPKDRNFERPPSRERPSRAPMSPPDLRREFVPERGDHWSPGHGQKRQKRSISPISNYYRPSYTRGDRWVPGPQRAPPGDVATLSKQSPPSRNALPDNIVWPRPLASPPKPSRPELERHSSDSRQAPLFRNLTWKVPSSESRPQPEPKESSTLHNEAGGGPVVLDSPSLNDNEDITAARMDFNGLKDVPVGPKRSSSSFAVPTISDSILRSPHIFICKDFMPSLGTILPHLFKKLRRYVTKELDVCVDEAGWYIRFENTPHGRQRLDKCYTQFNRDLLFGMYTLQMQAFPNGQPSFTIKSPASANVADSGRGSNASSRANEATVHNEPSSDGPVLPAQPALMNGRETDSNSGLQKAAAAPHIDRSVASSPPIAAAAQYMRHSLPLQVSSRHDKDDSSSMSGITSSDVSTSKRLKCHVCERAALSDSDVLVNCSSCPRRYHRRCHAQPIPNNLDTNHTWQCRRCIKKHIRPKSGLSFASPAKESSPAASVGQREERTLPLPQLDSFSTPMINFEARNHNAAVLSMNRANDTPEQPQSTATLELPFVDDSYEPAEYLIAMEDPKMLSEADRLVANSFASSSAVAPSPASTALKTKKLSLVRKKVGLTEMSAAVVSNQTTGPAESTTPTVAKVPVNPSRIRMPRSGVQQDDDAPVQVKIPDRWAARGADKDFIQAGKEDALQDDVPVLVEVTGTSDLPFAANMPTPVPIEMQRESPVAPNAAGTAPTLPVVDAIRRDGNKTSRSSTESTPGVMGGSGQDATGKTKRMKPPAPQTVRCLSCNKITAQRPSRKQLCIRCQNEDISARAVDTLQNQSERRPAEVSNDIELNPGLTAQQERAIAGPTDATAGLHAQIQQERQPSTANVSAKAEEPIKARTQPSHTITPDNGTDTDPERYSCNTVENPLESWSAQAKSATAELNDIDQGSLYQHPAPEHIEAGPNQCQEPSAEFDAHQLLPEDSLLDEAPPVQLARRQTQTRPAITEHDLGDSFTRPPNTYVKLIGMALCSADGYRMRGNEIVQWVVSNVPSYQLGQGKWENSLRATMTLKRAGYQDGEGLWRVVDEGSKRSQGFMYQLLPGKAETMLHWDPVLKKPVSPPKGWVVQEDRQLDDSAVSPMKQLLKRRKQPVGDKETTRSTPNGEALISGEQTIVDNDRTSLMSIDSDSSEEEPLVRARIKPTAPQERTPRELESTDRVLDDYTNIDNRAAKEIRKRTMEPVSYNVQPQNARRRVITAESVQPTIQEMIDADAKNINYNAKSLYEEWPQYDPKNQIDVEAKIAEIKARPTRKQRFGKQSVASQFEHKGPFSRYVFDKPYVAPHSSQRTSRKNPYPWEANDEDGVYVDTFAELLGIPSNPMSVFENGELIGYRDGTRNADGTLPRAKVIYRL